MESHKQLQKSERSIAEEITEIVQINVKSEWTAHYQLIFAGVQSIKVQSFQSALKQSNIVYHPEVFVNPTNIKHFSESQNCRVVTLFVSLSYFTMKIKIYNQDGASPAREKLEEIGKGSFGNVYKYVDSFHEEFAIKNILYATPFEGDFDSVQKQNASIIKEYCFCKLLSCFRVGPKVKNNFGFDLIVYDNSIEFALQLCEKVTPTTFRAQTSIASMKADMKFMHALKIIHSDIKQDNLMFSPTYQKVVFIDFNLSRVLNQKIGEKTFTCFNGNLANCSPEMKKLYLHRSSSFIDMYYNDGYGLHELITQKQKNDEASNIQWVDFQNRYENEGVCRFCECFYLHMKLKYFILEKDFEQCQEFVSKYSQWMVVTEQMRAKSRKVSKNSTIYEEIIQFNTIINSTLSMLIEIPFTQKLIPIHKKLFEVFNPSTSLASTIDKIFSKRSLILPFNEEQRDKYRSRFNFKQDNAKKSSLQIRTLEMVSIFLCKQHEEKTKKAVNLLIEEITCSGMNTLEAIDKLQAIINCYEINDSDLLRTFNFILHKQKCEKQLKLDPREKYKSLLKLQSKLKQKGFSAKQQSSKDAIKVVNWQIEELILRLQSYMSFQQEFDSNDDNFIQLGAQLMKILKDLRAWNSDFEKYEKTSQFSPSCFGNIIKQKIMHLEQSFEQFPVEHRVHFTAIYNYILCFCIRAKNYEGFSKKYKQAFASLSEFIISIGINEKQLKNGFIVARMVYNYQESGSKFVKTYADEIEKWSNQSLYLYCFLFTQNLFARCHRAKFFYSYHIDYEQIVELLSNTPDSIPILAQILENAESSHLRGVRQSIYSLLKQHLFESTYIYHDCIWSFYEEFFKNFCSDHPKEAPEMLDRLTRHVEKLRYSPYPIQYWTIQLTAQYDLRQFEECLSTMQKAKGCYPEIKKPKIERLYALMVEFAYEIIRFHKKSQQEISFIHQFLDHFILQRNSFSILAFSSAFACFNSLLQKKSVKKLVQLLLAIISNTRSVFAHEHQYLIFTTRIIFIQLQRFEVDLTIEIFESVFEAIQGFLSPDALAEVCAIVYPLYQMIMTFEFPKFQNQSKIAGAFFRFVWGHLKQSTFLIRRQIQVDWYHFALKQFQAKQNSPAFSSKRRNKLKLKQFRKSEYKSYCDYYQIIRQSIEKKHNKHAVISKMVAKIEEYHCNKMEYVVFDENVKASLLNRFRLSRFINDEDFYMFNLQYLKPIPKQGEDSWKLKIINPMQQLYFYRVYKIEANIVHGSRMSLRSKFLQFDPASGKMTVFDKSEPKFLKNNPIPNEQALTIKIDRLNARMIWQADEKILAQCCHTSFGQVNTKFEVEIRHEDFKIQFHFFHQASQP